MNRIGIRNKSIIIILALVLISCLFVFKNFLFGGQILAYTDIGSDTAGQYLMHYQTIINHLREGSFSLWDFNNGVGINMYSLNLFDPFLMILYGLGTVLGCENIYGMLVYMQIVRMLLAAVVIYLYLSCFCISEQSKIVGAYIYAFSGYMVVWGQHYQFGTNAILFPLLLFMVEMALRNKKWHLGITISCAAVSFCSMYFGYMQLMSLGFYTLFRVAWEERLFCKKGFRTVGAIYGSMILGIGMGMFQLIPSAMMIFGVSGRMGGASLLERVSVSLLPYKTPYYQTLFTRFFSSNLQGTNEFTGYQNYYEAPNVFLSVLFILTAVQFLYLILRDRKCNRSDMSSRFGNKQRNLLLLGCGVSLFLLLLPFGSLIFNGFAYPFSRHTFICMPFFVWMMVWMLDRMVLEQYRSCKLFLGTGLVCAGVYGVHLFGARMKLAVLLLGLTMVLVASLWQLSSKVCFKKCLMQAAFLLSIMGTMVLDSYFSFSYERGVLGRENTSYTKELYDPDVVQALNYLEETDDSFYRVEKDYIVGEAANCLNGLAQNYNGVSTYNSTLNSSTVDFYKQIWPNMYYINDDHFSFANAKMDTFPSAMLHVKYVLSKNADLKVPGYMLCKQFGDLFLYENKGTAQIGKFYTEVITEDTFSKEKDKLAQNELLSDYLICDTLPELMVSDLDEAQYMKENITKQCMVTASKEQGIVTISIDGAAFYEEQDILSVEFDLKNHVGGDLWADIAGEVISLYSEDEVYHATFKLPNGCESISIMDKTLEAASVFEVENVQIYKEEWKDLTSLSEGIFIEQPKKDSLVKGTAKVPKAGVLMLAIPYEAGWHAYVDDKEVEIHKVNYGFSGIYLDEGEHTVQMEFDCPGFTIGVLCSMFFLLLTVFIWCGIVKNDKKKIDIRKES